MTVHSCVKQAKTLMFNANEISQKSRQQMSEIISSARKSPEKHYAERFMELADSIQDNIDKINELLDLVEKDIFTMKGLKK